MGLLLTAAVSCAAAPLLSALCSCHAAACYVLQPQVMCFRPSAACKVLQPVHDVPAGSCVRLSCASVAAGMQPPSSTCGTFCLAKIPSIMLLLSASSSTADQQLEVPPCMSIPLSATLPLQPFNC